MTTPMTWLFARLCSLVHMKMRTAVHIDHGCQGCQSLHQGRHSWQGRPDLHALQVEDSNGNGYNVGTGLDVFVYNTLATVRALHAQTW